MPKLVRKRQLVAKIETTEGTAETLTSSDAGYLVEELNLDSDRDMYERNPVRETISRKGKVTGKKKGTIPFKMMVRGSGSVTTAPKIGTLLQACAFGEDALEQITIGAITGGPFVNGETITGGTSTETATVVVDTATGTTTLYFKDASGAFDSGEVLTGSTSGATATTGSIPSDAGFVYQPTSVYADIKSLTMAAYEDGQIKKYKGCRGTVGLSCETGQPLSAAFDFMGVEESIIDGTLLTGVTYESEVEPIALNTDFTANDVALVVGSLSLDVQNTVAPRDSIADVNGILSYMITDRQPQGSLDPESEALSTFDWFALQAANTEIPMDFTIGATVGNKFRFVVPTAQVTKVTGADREGIMIDDVAFDMNGAGNGDNELIILAL